MFLQVGVNILDVNASKAVENYIYIAYIWLVKVVLLGGQAIWYDRPTSLLSGLGFPAGAAAEPGSEPSTLKPAKAALRWELKSRLGLEEDR